MVLQLILITPTDCSTPAELEGSWPEKCHAHHAAELDRPLARRHVDFVIEGRAEPITYAPKHVVRRHLRRRRRFADLLADGSAEQRAAFDAYVEQVRRDLHQAHRAREQPRMTCSRHQSRQRCSDIGAGRP